MDYDYIKTNYPEVSTYGKDDNVFLVIIQNKLYSFLSDTATQNDINRIEYTFHNDYIELKEVLSTGAEYNSSINFYYIEQEILDEVFLCVDEGAISDISTLISSVF